MTPIVSLRGIRKSFGPVEVLHGVDFDVRAGEVHVVAGENGAGKSILIRILASESVEKKIVLGARLFTKANVGGGEPIR